MANNLCPACAIPSTPSHLHQWLESFFSEISQWIRSMVPVDLFRSQYTAKASQWYWKSFLRLLIATGITKKIHDPSRFSVHRTRALWESASKLGVSMTGFETAGNISNLFIAGYNGEEIFFEGLPRPLNASRATSWMDDKYQTREILRAEALPIARGKCVRSLEEAIALYRSLSKPVIVKPRSSSGSRHTTVHITTEEEFIRAFLLAKQTSWSVMVEEEIPGTVHRALTVDGTCIAVCRREMPLVRGDGEHSIQQLVAIENEYPRRDGSIYGKLPTTDDGSAAEELNRQGYSWDSIPSKGATVLLGDKQHRGRGAAVVEVTPNVHPDNRDLFERVATAVNDPIIGMDVIIEDIAASWTQQPCAIIELNSIPFIDLHTYPLYGTPVPVADAIWKMIFPQLKGNV